MQNSNEFVDGTSLWPTPCRCEKVKPRTNITRMGDKDKRILWEHLKVNHVETALLLVEVKKPDSELYELQQFFDAEILLDNEFVPGELIERT